MKLSKLAFSTYLFPPPKAAHPLNVIKDLAERDLDACVKDEYFI